MDDPRLLEWLELTQRVLDANEENLFEVLEQAHARRAELQASLESTPPENPPSAELIQKLRDSENTLDDLMMNLRTDMREKLAELRQIRSGTKGYRPARTNLPAFLSRSV